MDKKYEILKDNPIKYHPWYHNSIAYPIRALKDFADIKAGEIGGCIQKEENLSQTDDAWVYDGGWVFDDAVVREDSRIFTGGVIGGNAIVDHSFIDYTQITGNAIVKSSYISGRGIIFGNSKVSNVQIAEQIIICNDALITNTEDYVYFKGVLQDRVSPTNTTFFKLSDGNIGCTLNGVCLDSQNEEYKGFFTLDELNEQLKIHSNEFNTNTIARLTHLIELAKLSLNQN